MSMVTIAGMGWTKPHSDPRRERRRKREGREGGAGKLITTMRTATLKEREMRNPCSLILCSKYGMQRNSVKAANMSAIK